MDWKWMTCMAAPALAGLVLVGCEREPEAPSLPTPEQREEMRENAQDAAETLQQGTQEIREETQQEVQELQEDVQDELND